jgi:ABC-type Fe3+ transport system substrate-binding protein
MLSKAAKVSGALFVGLAVGLLGTPARAADAVLVAAAQKEGSVSWYTTIVVNQAVRPIAEAFEKKYPGIKVDYTFLNTDSEVLLRLSNEARAGHPQGDVADHGGDALNVMVSGNLIETYAPPAAASYPERLKSKDGYWTAINVAYESTAYNMNVLSEAEAPKTFQDLLDPKWKGKMVWSAQAAPTFVGNILSAMGKEDGTAYLRKLAQQKIVPFGGNQRVVLDQVVAGEYPIGLLIYTHHVQISREKGAKVDWIKMEPLVEDMNIISFVKGAPHPNAGKLLLDFILSEDGQRVLANANYVPANPTIPAKTPSLKPEDGHFKVTNFPREVVADSRKEWLRVYKEIFE